MQFQPLSIHQAVLWSCCRCRSTAIAKFSRALSCVFRRT